MPAKPNILLIMADQLAYDVMGVMGHPVVQTPHLDRLAASGTVFTNAYCNSPLCAPSRASLATGRLMRNTGVFDNGAELPASMPTLMHLIGASGYHTIASGKLHFIGPDQLHGFEERLTTDIFPAHFGWTPDWRQGPVLAKTNINKVKSAAACDWNSYLQYDEEVLFRSLERLRQLSTKKSGRPFFFQISFTHPHPPFEALDRFIDLYADAEIPLPHTSSTPSSEAHPYDRWLQIMHGVDKTQATEDEIRRARGIYYAMVAYIDDRIGRIVAELERVGLSETTRIVFTSDHGELLGEHGNWYKRHYYEHAVRVPLLVSGVGLPEGKRIDNIVSLVDLSATLGEWGGVPAELLQSMDGSSLDGLIRGRHSGWRDEAIFEYSGKGTIHYMAGIRSGRHKYVYVHEAAPLLFDLADDPWEETNLAEKLAVAAVRSRLESRLLHGIDPGRLEQRILTSQQQRLLINRSAVGQPAWDYQPAVDASKQYIRD